jgi:hypothetical protein
MHVFEGAGGRDVFDRLLWLTFSVICSTFTLVV